MKLLAWSGRGGISKGRRKTHQNNYSNCSSSPPPPSPPKNLFISAAPQVFSHLRLTWTVYCSFVCRTYCLNRKIRLKILNCVSFNVWWNRLSSRRLKFVQTFPFIFNTFLKGRGNGMIKFVGCQKNLMKKIVPKMSIGLSIDLWFWYLFGTNVSIHIHWMQWNMNKSECRIKHFQIDIQNHWNSARFHQHWVEIIFNSCRALVIINIYYWLWSYFDAE